MKSTSIDLNCDLGENNDNPGVQRDLELLTIVTSANIACGGHAGDELSMKRIVSDALRLGVSIGAHPSFPDRAGFGRAPSHASVDRILTASLEQVHQLMDIAADLGAHVRHVKPHGALYHCISDDPSLATEFAGALKERDASLIFVARAGSPAIAKWRANHIACISEAFVDRAYASDGSLIPREAPGALLLDPSAAVSAALEIALRGRVRAVDGSYVLLEAETLCVHSDTPGAPAIARAVRGALEAAGVTICTPAIHHRS